jgi:hypothetical protein
MLGIISPEGTDPALGSIPLTPESIKEIQDSSDKYGLTAGKYPIWFSPLAVKWTQTNFAARDLMLFEETKEDLLAICSAFGYPYRLLAITESGNMAGSDIRDLQKTWYQNSIIPETAEKVGALNSFFETENESWHIVATFDHLPFLQEDKKAKIETIDKAVTALSKAYQDGAITLEQYQSELEYYGISY